jgi:hypothetical protein
METRYLNLEKTQSFASDAEKQAHYKAWATQWHEFRRKRGSTAVLRDLHAQIAGRSDVSRRRS